MSDRRRTVRRYATFVTICLALELIVLVWPEAKTEDDGWIGRGLSGEIAGGTVLEQWIHATGANLRAVTFYPRAYGSRTAGTAHLSLTEIRRDDRRLIDERTVPAAEVAMAGSFTYRFPPIALSTSRNYMLTIGVPDAAPGTGLMVDVLHRRYGDNPPNRLYFDGRERWGSLRFTAEIDRPIMLVRIARYLPETALGPAAFVVFLTCWIGLHVLGARAIVLMAALSSRLPDQGSAASQASAI